MIILVTGPTNSGKSLWAEKLLNESSSVVYIATLRIPSNLKDKCLLERIRIHRERRPEDWLVIESKGYLHKDLQEVKSKKSVLIDSLGGFVCANLSLDSKEWLSAQDMMLESIKQFDGKIVVVSEEIGWGVVSSTEVGNIFRDRLSKLTRVIEYISTYSWLVVQGRALNLKKLGIPIS